MPEIKQYQDKVVPNTFTIASGQSSGIINMRGTTLCGITRPAGIASTTFTIKVYTDVNDTVGGSLSEGDGSAAAKSFTVDSNRGYTAIDPALTAGAQFISIEMGSSETDETFTLHVRSV